MWPDVGRVRARGALPDRRVRAGAGPPAARAWPDSGDEHVTGAGWTDKQLATLAAFRDAVNMTPSALSTWLKTDASRKVGSKDAGGESVGHASGRRIVEIRRTKTDALTAADVSHMAKVVGYVRRHLAQRPAGDVRETRWRHSLMNWGHDPLRGARLHGRWSLLIRTASR